MKTDWIDAVVLIVGLIALVVLTCLLWLPLQDDYVLLMDK